MFYAWNTFIQTLFAPVTILIYLVGLLGRQSPALALALLVSVCSTGCIVSPANPADFKATEPAHTRIKKGLFGAELYNSKDFSGHAKFNPTTGEFDVQITDIASKVNETLVPMLESIQGLQQKQNEGLDRVVQQHQEIGRTVTGIAQTISQLGLQSAQVLTSLTNVPGMVASALTGKPYTPNAPPALAPAPPAIDEASMRRIVREELRALLAEAGHLNP